jgi:hypothetical protein
MPLMTIFEPLFLLLLLATVVALVTTAIQAMRGRQARALAILRRLCISAAIYLGIVTMVSAASSRRVFHQGDQRCFDDWCITVEDAQRSFSQSTLSYAVTLRLSSRARRVPQRENGTVVYLIDARGRRFDPVAEPSDVPLNALLQPGESAIAKRRFELPADAREVGLIYTHEGGFPIGWFIVGENHWFHGPDIVRLD